MLRFTIKVGLAAGAVHYINKEGVWLESSESLKTCDRLGTALEPYVKEVKNQMPFEIPEIPKEYRSYEVARQCWNKGVTSTFQFLSELPSNANTWTQQGVKKILDNPDVKSIFTAAPDTSDGN